MLVKRGPVGNLLGYNFFFCVGSEISQMLKIGVGGRNARKSETWSLNKN